MTTSPFHEYFTRIRRTGPHDEFSNQELAVLRSITMMRRNLSEQLTVDTLATWAFFSKYHYTRVFHRLTGLPPGHFISEYRVMTAEHLLATTDLTFTEITYRVGYASVGTFSSRFKEMLGVSPSEYRAQTDGLSGTGPGARSSVRPQTRPQTRLVLDALARAESVAGCCAAPLDEPGSLTWQRVS